jgi:ATP-grasp domain, R2K clade family 2
MSTPTLILTPRYTDDAQALWKAAAARGWRTERLSSWRIPEHLRDIEMPVIYGEALFGPALAEQFGLTLLNPAEDWLVRLPFEYKLRHIRLTSLQHARLNKEAAFVKPPNDKSFPAGVYVGVELPTEYVGNTPVLVSQVVGWEKEFRCFILHRSLHTYSIYSRHGALQHDAGFVSSAEEDQQLEVFVQTLLADPRVDMPDAVVIDVGTIGNGKWACVEQNAAWGAGIYGCSPGTVLDVLRHAAIRL